MSCNLATHISYHLFLQYSDNCFRVWAWVIPVGRWVVLWEAWVPWVLETWCKATKAGARLLRPRDIQVSFVGWWLLILSEPNETLFRYRELLLSRPNLRLLLTKPWTYCCCLSCLTIWKFSGMKYCIRSKDKLIQKWTYQDCAILGDIIYLQEKHLHCLLYISGIFPTKEFWLCVSYHFFISWFVSYISFF